MVEHRWGRGGDMSALRRMLALLISKMCSCRGNICMSKWSRTELLNTIMGPGYACLVCWSTVEVCRPRPCDGGGVQHSLIPPSYPTQSPGVMELVRSQCVVRMVHMVGLLVDCCVRVYQILRCDGGVVRRACTPPGLVALVGK